MYYHINTSLILQEFPKDSECPLCTIRKIVEKQSVESYLNEKVMVRSIRAEVNDKGFCKEHYDKLFEGQSKLGLALQTVTRLNVLLESVTDEKSYFRAKKHAQKLYNSETTCIICDDIEKHMQRYYMTVAQMFFNEPEFKDMLKATKGFCLHDYAGLLLNAKCAETSLKPYLQCLSELQKNNTARLRDELQEFCDHHNYRNRDKPLGSSKDSLSRARTKIYGKK